jgi:adenylate cyclase
MAPEAVDHKLAAILSADAVGYSRLMAEDEAATIRTLSSYREQIGVLVREHRGRVVDSPGDNVLAEFPTALEAVRCAVELQGVLRARNASLPADRRMDFRIGVHMGDVATQGGRIYGDGVNIAARLEALAEAGGVCISATVHEQVRNKLEAGFTDLGDQTVKNIPDQVRVYRVQPPGQSETPSAEKATPVKRPRRLRTALVATAAVLLLLGVGLWASWPRPLGLLIDLAGVSGPLDEPALPDKPSLVVLPFENMSGDPEQEYFSDGITEELTNTLAGSPFIFVIARNSAFTYKGQHVNVEEVGRELGVRYVLEGSVRKAEDRVRITAQLIDATTAGHLWSESYDRDLSHIFALQAEIAEEVASRVGGEIFRAEGQRLARRPTASLSAYEAFQKGNFHILRNTMKDNQAARALFARAQELDPNFVGAHASLGITYWVEYASGWSRDPALLDRAEELGRRGIALDPAYFHSYAPIAWAEFLRGNLPEALTATERAIELAPSFEVGHALRGMILAQQGRLLEATGSIRRALRLSPRAPNVGVLAGVAYVNFAAGRREEAVQFMERARAAAPDNVTIRVPLVGFYEMNGMHEKARGVVAEILRVRPDLTVEDAMELFPGLDQSLSPEEVANYPDVLRAAGLPAS